MTTPDETAAPVPVSVVYDGRHSALCRTNCAVGGCAAPRTTDGCGGCCDCLGGCERGYEEQHLEAEQAAARPAEKTPLWATRPRWARAHAVVHAGSMFGEQSWLTKCQRDYPLDDPLNDEPTPAPATMSRCAHCTDVLAGKRT